MKGFFDSHAHLISDDHDRYRIAPLSGTLRSGDLDYPMTAERLIQEMDANGVERALAVQRGHIYGFDNSYVCDSAAKYPDRLRAVCSIDGRDPQCGAYVQHWVHDRGAVGVRLMEPFKGADPSWYAGETARSLWVVASDLGIPICIHFFSWNRETGLQALKGRLQEFRDTPVVIDHFSNMNTAAGPPDHGVDPLLLDIAEFPRVCTKFTTIPLGQLDAAGIDAAPVVKRVVQVFGAQRVMWGSDIAQSQGAYSYMVGLALKATRLLGHDERTCVLHDCAAATYA